MQVNKWVLRCERRPMVLFMNQSYEMNALVSRIKCESMLSSGENSKTSFK